MFRFQVETNLRTKLRYAIKEQDEALVTFIEVECIMGNYSKNFRDKSNLTV